MAVKLRLMRMGKKRQPTYRVVAADSHSPRDGRFIEIVGTYQPRADPSVVLIDNERAVSWLKKGAQPTETVRKILVISGAWDEFTGKPSDKAPSKAPTSTSESKQALSEPQPSEVPVVEASDEENA